MKQVGKTKDTDEPIYRVTYTTCPECNSKSYIYDSHHDESVCVLCGLVIEDTQLEKYEYKYLVTYDGLTPSEQRYIKYKLNHTRLKPEYSMTAWYLNDKKRRIDSILCQLCLNKQHRDEISNFLVSTNFNQLSSRLPFNKIVYCAYQFYMVHVVGVPPRSGFYEEYNLCKDEYTMVERKLRKEWKL